MGDGNQRRAIMSRGTTILEGSSMSRWEDDVNRHAAELVRLTLKAADQGPEPLPEDEVARLGKVIATERQLLIDAMSGLLQHDEPEAAASPGVAEFDAGFLYGLAFARALEDARMALDRDRRRRILRLAKGNANQVADNTAP
jgi:hypothetical protein